MNGSRMDRPIRIAGIAAALLAAGTVWYWSAADSPRPDLSDPLLISEGEQLYRLHCASCHGADLEGHPDWQERLPDGSLHPPPHDETGHTWHHADSLLFGITKQGGQEFAPADFTSNMPGFGEILSDREIWATIAYIKSRWPEEIRERQSRMSAR